MREPSPLSRGFDCWLACTEWQQRWLPADRGDGGTISGGYGFSLIPYTGHAVGLAKPSQLCAIRRQPTSRGVRNLKSREALAAS